MGTRESEVADTYIRSKVKGEVVSVQAIKACGRGIEVELRSFLTSALDGGEWSM